MVALKKIAFVATVYRHLETFHVPFIRLLQDRGYQIYAYASSGPGKHRLEELGVVCRDIPFQRNPMRFQNVVALITLTKEFMEHDFALVHVHTPIASVIARLAAFLAKRQSVMIYTAHGFHFYSGAPLSYWLIYYPLEWLMSFATDYLITINREDYTRAKRFPVKGGVMLVPGVGVDTRFYQNTTFSGLMDLRNELSIGDGTFVILCVAELNDNKNQVQIIRAMEVITKTDNEISCLLVGAGTSQRYLERMIASLGLEGYVKILGYRQDVAELIALGDAVILLSKREGLPKAILEAMAAGKPIVASNVRGNRDLVVDGKSGFLVPVGDVEQTVLAIKRLRSDQSLRYQMGRYNLEVVASYGIEQILPKMSSIYDLALLSNQKGVFE